MPMSLPPIIALLVGLAACDAPGSTAPARLPAGAVVVGARPDEPCRDAEARARTVQVPALAVDRTEATQASWATLAGLPPDPSFGPRCPTCPVDSLTHGEARAYCAARSAAEGLPRCTTGDTDCRGWRLPTGDEWEAAARAGSRTSTWAGDITVCMRTDATADAAGWTKASSGGQPHPVGQRPANPLGLVDVVGNLAEWTADPPDAAGLRPLRGGSWYHNAEHARAAAVLWAPPERRLSWAGVRCVRSLP